MRTPAIIASSALLILTACAAGETPGTGSSGSGGAKGCDEITNVSDGPTEDSIAAGATSIVCYYASPKEGYCRKITDPGVINSFYTTNHDKGAIGCADAVILTNAECPTANATGRCEATSIEAERLYYKCTKFDDPAANCIQVQGAFTEL